MKEITWLSPTRSIPKYGLARTGESIILPTNLANKFIGQGDAKAMPKAAKKKESE